MAAHQKIAKTVKKKKKRKKTITEGVSCRRFERKVIENNSSLWIKSHIMVTDPSTEMCALINPFDATVNATVQRQFKHLLQNNYV